MSPSTGSAATLPGPTCASSSRPRATPSTTPGPPSARLETAFTDGALERTASLDLFLADLMRALDQDEGEKLGGKSAEAARFILRAIDRELDRA